MKTKFILAAILSLATVTAMADSHHHKHHKNHRNNHRVVVIKQNHNSYQDSYHVAKPKRNIAKRNIVHHNDRRVAPHVVKEYNYVTVTPPASHFIHHTPVIPLRPSASFSFNVNL
ncbi:MAG: hypothetical protein IK065_06065 [Neisseriaceae bacterium]|nr:hypothetical protein [Neisseriaceae bacterium]